MGQDLAAIAEYFHGAKTTIWDFVAVAVILLLLLIVIILSVRYYIRFIRVKQRMDRLAAAARGETGPKARENPRTKVRIPVQITSLLSEVSYSAEVLDISAGGVKLYFDKESIYETEKVVLASSEPPWNNLGRPIMTIVRTIPVPDSDAWIVHGKWDNLEKQTAKKLNKAIQRSLREEGF